MRKFTCTRGLKCLAIILLGITFGSQCAFAQKPGKLVIVQDPAIDSLVNNTTRSTPADTYGQGDAAYRPLPKTETAAPVTAPALPAAPAAPVAKKVAAPVRKHTGGVLNILGYRVQIYYGSDRRQLNSVKTRFDREYPKYNSYISFTSPNYYLTVGDFRSRYEAQELLNQLRGVYPVLFIKREKVRIYY